MRWETLALAGVICLILVFSGLLAGRSSPRAGSVDTAQRSLRRDDMLFIVLGIVPGAVIGGRLTYVLIHLDYYHANPGIGLRPIERQPDPDRRRRPGHADRLLRRRLLDAPVGRWLDVAAVGLILGLGLGKLANVLGGNGQGLLSSAELGHGVPRDRGRGASSARSCQPSLPRSTRRSATPWSCSSS